MRSIHQLLRAGLARDDLGYLKGHVCYSVILLVVANCTASCPDLEKTGDFALWKSFTAKWLYALKLALYCSLFLGGAVLHHDKFTVYETDIGRSNQVFCSLG